MKSPQRLRELAYWWKSLWPPARVLLVVVPALVLTLVVALALRAGRSGATSRSPDATSLPVYPTSYGSVNTFPTEVTTGSPAPLLSDGRLVYAPEWGTLEVRQFLEDRPGTLGRMRIWVGDGEVPVADVITGQSLLYSVSPKVVLALLEFQSGLVDDPNPSAGAIDQAMGYADPATLGLDAQLRWAIRELFRGMRDYSVVNSLLLRDGRTIPVPEGTNLGGYAVLRLVAQTGDEATLGRLQGMGQESFVETYRRLFNEDPRQPLGNPPRLASLPFLYKPYEGDFEISSVFDHHSPFLNVDGEVIAHMGDGAPDMSYDGHNGWDYALDMNTPVLAAADGTVIWAGESNDGCGWAARGVVLDHGNGYRTLYWHLSLVYVTAGEQVSRGDTIGLAGATGCADGPHLHFGVYFLGRQADPEGWCGTGTDPWMDHAAGTMGRWLWADRFSPCLWPTGSILVDDADTAFVRSGTQWDVASGGVGGDAQWAPSEPRSGVVPIGDTGQLNGVVEGATWRPDLPQEGKYHLYAFIPYWVNGVPDSQAAHYLVRHADGERIVVVDQMLHTDRWADLGVYRFAAGRQGFVYLDNLTDEAGFCVWFDALLWVPEP